MRDAVRLLVVEQAALTGPCELCAAGSDPRSAVVVVDHTRGGQVRFFACARCTRAARRLAAALGGSGQGGAVDIAAAARVDQPPPPQWASAAGPIAPAELILESDHQFSDDAGTAYTVRVYGAARPTGTWIGWIEFSAIEAGVVLRTGRETTQSNREALSYWAAGLEPAYFEGAFARAR